MTDLHAVVLNRVVLEIFRTEEEEQQREIDEVITQNQTLYGSGTDSGFWYRDRWYASRDRVGTSTQVLHEDLYPKMERLAAHIKRTENDRQIFRQVLGKLIHKCQNLQEIRDELPETIINLDPDMWYQYQRTGPEAQSIRDNPRDLRQYEKVLMKIRGYCALRLVL